MKHVCDIIIFFLSVTLVLMLEHWNSFTDVQRKSKGWFLNHENEKKSRGHVDLKSRSDSWHYGDI